MALYKRNDVLPEWEPIPWDLEGEAADEQERGFHARATKPIEWRSIRFDDFPPEGLFGHDRDWFSSNDVHGVATRDDEDLILIRNTWHGFPDPPEWGLASRPVGSREHPWTWWGHFPELPAPWILR